jgi:hypothetical protein
MSEKRTTRDEVQTTTGRNEVGNIVRDNTLRIVDEAVKAHPQFAQSISNLQLESIQIARNIIQTAFANQKEVVFNVNTPQTAHFSENISKQSTEVTNNIIRSIGIFSQLGINALDSARENLKIYSRTIDTITDFNNNVSRAWASYWYSQQHQLDRA